MINGFTRKTLWLLCITNAVQKCKFLLILFSVLYILFMGLTKMYKPSQVRQIRKTNMKPLAYTDSFCVCTEEMWDGNTVSRFRFKHEHIQCRCKKKIRHVQTAK